MFEFQNCQLICKNQCSNCDLQLPLPLIAHLPDPEARAIIRTKIIYEEQTYLLVGKLTIPIYVALLELQWQSCLSEI